MFQLFGPVLHQELMRSARRWQTYVARSLFIAALLGALLVVWIFRVGPFATLSINTLARLGEPLFYGMVGTQLALVLLAAPASAAGAICVDRGRGTLAHVLVTDLTAFEIVLGKLAARLAWLLGLLAASLPVLALSVLLGGVDPSAVAGAYLVATGAAVVGCTLGLLLSVWGRRTHEVLIVAYLLWLMLLLIHPACWLVAWVGSEAAGALLPWAEYTNPFWLSFAPYLASGRTDLTEPTVFLGVCLLLSLLLAVVAVVDLRRSVTAALNHGEGRPTSRRRRHALPWPTLDDNPVLWLTCRTGRPSGWTGLAWLLYVVLSLAFSALAGLTVWPQSRLGVPSLVNSVGVSVGFLFVTIHAAASLAEERSRNALELLLTTPLSSEKILMGYWLGAFRPVPLLAVLPVLVVCGQGLPGTTLTAAALALLIVAYGALLTSVGTSAAVWTSRPGWAVTAAVAVFGLLTAGWITFIANTFDAQPFGLALAMASPWFGVLLLSGEPFAFWGEEAGAAVLFWTVMHLIAAGLLFLAALRTFDRCVGRATLPPTGPGRMP